MATEEKNEVYLTTLLRNNSNETIDDLLGAVKTLQSIPAILERLSEVNGRDAEHAQGRVDAIISALSDVASQAVATRDQITPKTVDMTAMAMAESGIYLDMQHRTVDL